MPENLATVYGPEETKLHAALIDQSFDGGQAARAEAIRRRTERLNEGGKVSRMVKGIWDNISGDYYQLRDTRAAQKQIEVTGDVTMFENTSRGHSDRSRAATVSRFTSEYEETIHTEAGEKREVQAPEDELATEIKELIRRSVEGGLSDASMAEERTRILNAYYETHGADAIGEGKVTVDNLLAIRDATLGAIENGESLDRVLANMTVSMGEARSGVRTEANYTMVDKLIDKVNKTTVGSLIGPEVVATAATIATSLLRFGSHKVLAAAAMTVVPGATAGLWAGLRENKRVKDERVQHARDMAEGKEFEPGAKRREEMETARYETVRSIELAENLKNIFGENVDLNDTEALRTALDVLAATQARIRMSDQQKIDLISYTEGDVEEQRLALDVALAQAKITAEHHLSPEVILALGLPPNTELNDLLSQRSVSFIESLETDISKKDAAFKSLKARRVAKAAVAGVIIGVTVGAVFQEGAAALSDSRQGLIEGLWGAQNVPFEGEQHQTLLNGLVHGEGGQDIVTHHAAETAMNSYTIGANGGTYSVSGEHSLIENGNGTINLVDPTGSVTIENLPVEADGSMSQASLDVLAAHNMNVIDTSAPVDIVTHETQSVGVDQYIGNHSDQVTSVNRQLWFDNNTPGKFDQNELGLHWGGTNGVTESGGFAFNVSSMTENGSFHGGSSANWAEQAQNGTLKLAISASENSQDTVFMVDVSPDGNIDIAPGSPAAQFFSVEDGRAVFDGKYAEVVQINGVDANGTESISPLATFVGKDNVGEMTDVVETHTTQIHPEYTIVSDGYDTTEHFNSFTEMAPVIPIISRRPLENLVKRTHNYYEYGYEGDGDMSEAEVVKETNERSPRIKSNPEAELVPQQELNWFKDELADRRGAENLALVEQKIDNSPELSSMSGEVETIVTIPVAAAQEADTIYGALSLYGRQNVESLRKSLVLLNLNWLDKTMTDPAKKAAIEKSRQEIERARQDFPALKIAVVENEYRSARVEETGGVIGYVAADLADTALLAIQKRMESGAMDPDHEVLLIRNDADPEGMSIRYLDKYQQALHGPKNKDMDVFKGVTRFGVKWAEKYPGFAVASNFAAGLSVALSSRGLPATGGANFAIKASTLAAIGGLGVMTRTGAGSDDGALGRRIRHARNGIGIIRKADNTQTSILPNGEKVNYRAVAAHVGGATVDTNPSRLVPYYVQGTSYSTAWGSDFSSGDGGYRERAAGMAVTPDGKSEIAADWDMQFSGIEATITSEMHWNGTRDINHALFVFFGHVPGAYTITGAGSNREDESHYHHAQFKLTKAGKKYLKKRFERDGYGKNLRDNLYNGNAGQGRVPTLVSPL